MNISNNLKKLDKNLVELTSQQLKTVSGGYYWWTPVGIAISVTIAVWDATDAFIVVMKEAYKDLKS